MVRTRRKKKAISSKKILKENEATDSDLAETKTSDTVLLNEATSSKKALKENEAADSDLTETKTSDTVLLNVDQPKSSISCDDKVVKWHNQETDEEEEETNIEEIKIVTVDIVDENRAITEINCDNSAKEDQNTSINDALDYQKAGMFEDDEENSEGDDQENSEGDDQENVAEYNEDGVEEEEEEEEEELKVGDEGSEEDDKDSEEGDEDFDDLEEGDEEYDDLEEGDEEYMDLEEDEEEPEDDEEEPEEGDGESEEGDEQTEGDREKENEEGKIENVDEVGGTAVEPNTDKVEAGLKEEVDKSPGRKRKKLMTRSSKKVESGNKPKALLKRKTKRRVETMGMIFMCTSTTKSDCYRYRVLGLPASKKDVVEKIYRGMRLFLYDVDLKMLNGIYKAVGPGGYNIEPKAFNSQFPSQVRFTIMDDCLPVAEEKFKKVIKDNYYTSTKFDCLLTSKQVKNLCKLFVSTSKGGQHKRFVRSSKDEKLRIVLRDKLRKQRADGVKHHAVREAVRYREHPRKRVRKAITSVVSVPSSALSHGYDRTFEVDARRLKPHIESHDRHQDGQDLLLSRGNSYRNTRDPPTEKFDSYRDGRERRDYYRDRRNPPSDRRDPYRDGRDLHQQRRSPYRDGRESYLQHRSPYRDGRDSYLQHRSPDRDGRDSYLQHGSPDRDGRDSYLQHRSPYRDGQDSYLQHRSPYRDGRDSYYRDGKDSHIQRRSPYRERRNSDRISPYGEGRDADTLHQSPNRDRRDLVIDRPDPYRGVRDPYPEHRSPYRSRRDTYSERRDPPSDTRDSYLQSARPFKDTPLSEPHDTYRRGPISDRRDVYREDRLAETRDAFERLCDPEPAHLETRRLSDIRSRDSFASYHLSYSEAKHSAEYPSRAGLERDYHPVGPMTDLYSSRGRLPEYSYRRA